MRVLEAAAGGTPLWPVIKANAYRHADKAAETRNRRPFTNLGVAVGRSSVIH